MRRVRHLCSPGTIVFAESDGKDDPDLVGLTPAERHDRLVNDSNVELALRLTQKIQPTNADATFKLVRYTSCAILQHQEGPPRREDWWRFLSITSTAAAISSPLPHFPPLSQRRSPRAIDRLVEAVRQR